MFEANGLRSRRRFAFSFLCIALTTWACVQTQAPPSTPEKTIKKASSPVQDGGTSQNPKSDLQSRQVSGAALPPALPRFQTPKSKTRLALLWTASVQGYVAPCGCTAEPLGGVARHLALVKEAKQFYGERVLVLDAGDLLFDKADDNNPADECQATARSDLLLSTYAQAEVAATTLGILDDARGPQWRDQRLQKQNILTIGINLPRPITSKAPHASSRIFDRGGLKIGVSAFFLDDVDLSTVNEQAKKVRPILQAEIESLHLQGAQAVVLLAQATRKQTRLLLDGVTGVDVILVGRRPGEQPTQAEKLSSGAVMLAAGAQAQYIGVAELELGQRQTGTPLPLDDGEERAKQRMLRLEQKVEQYQKQVAELDDGPRKEFVEQRITAAQQELKELSETTIRSPEGPHVQVRSVALSRRSLVDEKAKLALKAYEASIPKLVAGCEANLVCEPAQPNMPTYVGAETCAACHRAANRFWQKQVLKVEATAADGTKFEREVGHVKAWDTLVEGGKESDRSCVGCHSIGFMEPGGYCKTSEVDFRTGVQCESCHGPGSQHVTEGDPRYIPRPTVDERTCRGCHQVPHIPTTESFVYNEKLLHILGKGHGEARLKTLSGVNP